MTHAWGRRELLLSAVPLALLACEGATPQPLSPESPTAMRPFYADEVIPADLDCVFRVDVGEARKALAERATEARETLSHEPLIAAALEQAEVLTVGLRFRHLAEGDRVLVVESRENPPPPEGSGFAEGPSQNPHVRVFNRQGDAPRDGTQMIVLLSERATVFVSPSEVDAVLRVLRTAPDEWRGRPAAEGLVSADVRPGRMPPLYEKRYKSFAKLLGSVQRLKAKLAVSEEALELDCNLFADDDVAAGNLAQFFDAIAENAPNTPLGRMLSSIQRNKVGTVLHLRARLPPELLVALWSARNTVDPVAPLRE